MQGIPQKLKITNTEFRCSSGIC